MQVTTSDALTLFLYTEKKTSYFSTSEHIIKQLHNNICLSYSLLGPNVTIVVSSWHNCKVTGWGKGQY